MVVPFRYVVRLEVVGVGEVRLEICKAQIIKGLICEAKEFGFYLKGKEEPLILSREYLIRFAF